MHKILMVFLALFLSISTCQKKSSDSNNITMVSVEDTLTHSQLDSLFIADTLSFNIEEDWINSTVLNEDKSKLLYKYVYIKSLTDSTGTIYTLYSYQDTLFIINKRVVK